MSEAAGYQAKHYYSADGDTWTEILTATDAKPGGQKNDMLDRTKYSQGDAQKRRSKGLHDNSFSLKCDYDAADTTQAAMIAAVDGGSDIYIKTLHDGTHGYSQKFIGESYDITPPVNGKVEINFSLQANGAKTAIP